MYAEFYTLYGESPEFMERYVLEPKKIAPPFVVKIEIGSLNDKSNVTFISAAYNKNLRRFVIRVKNTGPVDAYVDAVIEDIVIDEVKQNLNHEGVVKVSVGKTKELYIKAKLTEADILDNPTLKIKIFYGQNKDALIKVIKVGIDFYGPLKPYFAISEVKHETIKLANKPVGVLSFSLEVKSSLPKATTPLRFYLYATNEVYYIGEITVTVY